MKLNILFTVNAVHAIIYSIFGLMFTEFMSSLLFNNPTGSDAFILGRGWSACLIALGIIVWSTRSQEDIKSRKNIVLGMFVYFIISDVIWFLDQCARGWILWGWITFFLLLIFTDRLRLFLTF